MDVKDTPAKLVSALSEIRGEHLFNPWGETCQQDLGPMACENRRARYIVHLANEQSKYLLVGEAAGYQGCRYSGIPFTSERQLMELEIPHLWPMVQRITVRNKPWSEPSATIVWNTLRRLGIEKQVILWNAVPWHPHRPGEPLSNRTPTKDELRLGLGFLERAVALFSGCEVIAVGRKAEAALQEIGVECHAVRHPSRGGATEFARNLEEIVSRESLRNS